MFSASTRRSETLVRWMKGCWLGEKGSLSDFIWLVVLQSLQRSESFLIFLFINTHFLGHMVYLYFSPGKSHHLFFHFFLGDKFSPFSLKNININLNDSFVSFVLAPTAFTLASLFTRRTILINSRSTLPSLMGVVFALINGCWKFTENRIWYLYFRQQHLVHSSITSVFSLA